MVPVLALQAETVEVKLATGALVEVTVIVVVFTQPTASLQIGYICPGEARKDVERLKGATIDAVGKGNSALPGSGMVALLLLQVALVVAAVTVAEGALPTVTEAVAVQPFTSIRTVTV